MNILEVRKPVDWLPHYFQIDNFHRLVASWFKTPMFEAINHPGIENTIRGNSKTPENEGFADWSSEIGEYEIQS